MECPKCSYNVVKFQDNVKCARCSFSSSRKLYNDWYAKQQGFKDYKSMIKFRNNILNYEI